MWKYARRIAINTVYECNCGIFLVCNKKKKRKKDVMYSATIASRKLLINVVKCLEARDT